MEKVQKYKKDADNLIFSIAYEPIKKIDSRTSRNYQGKNGIIPGLKQTDVRKYLSEIRDASKHDGNVYPHQILSNGMTAGRFALEYVYRYIIIRRLRR